ncbi:MULTISPECIES: hypothetical protein [unclassified Fusibacter]|uniref:hypothetical protein n=1 Tax=unclassified Fusibacter TaxID=2624464 RepID=UPI0010120C88|nr:MULTISPECIES: hypothetical protein [unclassified Fusibacter]MCK8060944.1 hypothetical protein [Fusibacter sp. A2]NPE23240.1 hypothetical protein [Fusibacter sp. A1]RXV59594.1 hypothetical protein DWB64_15520 [Fusibacter sp. A1]
MFLRYVRSQHKEMVSVFLGVGVIASLVQIALFKNPLISSILTSFVGIGVLLGLFLTITYRNVRRGMKKRNCHYMVTRTGKFSGTSKLFYCNLYENQLRSADSHSSFKFDMNRAMMAGLHKKGYYYIREGRTNYFVFTIK